MSSLCVGPSHIDWCYSINIYLTFATQQNNSSISGNTVSPTNGKVCGQHIMIDLYVMERTDAPGIVKIGSSRDPERRRRELQDCHTFEMKLLAVFPGKGFLEHEVHHSLSHVRVPTGRGREWYYLTPAQAFVAVSNVAFPEPKPRPEAPTSWESYEYRGQGSGV